MLGMSLHEALERSEPLAALGARLRESAARLAAIEGSVPAAMRSRLRAGPIDESGWSVLVDNPGVSAKLRQLKPVLERKMVQAGFAPIPLRIKVHVPGRDGL